MHFVAIFSKMVEEEEKATNKCLGSLEIFAIKNAEILGIISQVVFELAVFSLHLEASLHSHRSNWNVYFVSFHIHSRFTVEKRLYDFNWYHH